MQIFTNTRFDFMGKGKLGLALSAVLLVVSIFAVFYYGFNLGIDFRGGTEIEVKFVQEPELADLRARLGALELGDVSLQRVGRPDEHTVLVRAPFIEGAGESVSKQIVELLYTPEELQASRAGLLNLNQVGEKELARFLGGCVAPEVDATAMASEMERIRAAAGGVLASYESLAAVPGLSGEVRSCLEQGSFLPGFAKRKDYFVGPKVGQELRTQAIWAIAVSLAGILIYITLRFQLEYGIGAVIALFHDVIVTTGLLILYNEEFSLTVVAALLTLAGYSVNDSIVVYDRIRENVRLKRTMSLSDVINLSLNQTLSRTLLTAGSTLLVVATMLLFGGPEFHGFSVTLLIGIVLGTYSSIFVASPIVFLWHGFFKRARERRLARA